MSSHSLSTSPPTPQDYPSRGSIHTQASTSLRSKTVPAPALPLPPSAAQPTSIHTIYRVYNSQHSRTTHIYLSYLPPPVPSPPAPTPHPPPPTVPRISTYTFPSTAASYPPSYPILPPPTRSISPSLPHPITPHASGNHPTNIPPNQKISTST